MCVFFLGTSHNMDSNRAYQSEHVAQDSKHKLVDSSPSDRDNLMVILHVGWKIVSRDGRCC